MKTTHHLTIALRRFLPALVGVAGLAPAIAQDPNNVFPSNFYPPRTGAFGGAGTAVFPDGTVVSEVTLGAPKLSKPLPADGAPAVSVTTEIEFSAKVNGTKTGKRLAVAVILSTAHTCEITLPALPASGEPSLPGGVMLRESPTLASSGSITATPLGDGDYQIDSFFDVFFELSTDGGTTWVPAGAALHLELAREATRHFAPTSAVWNGPGLSFTVVQLTDGKILRTFRTDPEGRDPISPTTGGPALSSHDWTVSATIDSGSSGTALVSNAPAVFDIASTFVGDADGTTRGVHSIVGMTTLDFGGGTRLRLSPTVPSTGESTIEPQPDGNFRIGSFFDIFTELSTDGGNTWTPVAEPIRIEWEPAVKKFTVPTDFFPPRGAVFGDGLNESESQYADGARVVRMRVRATNASPVLAQLSTMPVGGTENIDIDTTVEGVAKLAGSIMAGTFTGGPGNLTLQVSRTAPRTFDTEVLAVQFDCGGFHLRESPTRRSLGKITLEEQADGNFRIGSFFDIWTELSVDGGTTWSPADQPQHLAMALPVPAEFHSSNFLPLRGITAMDDWEAPVAFVGNISQIRSLTLESLSDTGSSSDRAIAPPPATTRLNAWASVVELQVPNGTGTGFVPVTAPATVRTSVTNNGTSTDGTGTFDTEMLQLDISGGTLPAGMMLRESPTRASTGKTTIVAVAGGFRISSFFDVFPEISTDGGATWSPAAEPIRLVQHAAPEPVIAVSDVFPPNGSEFRYRAITEEDLPFPIEWGGTGSDAAMRAGGVAFGALQITPDPGSARYTPPATGFLTSTSGVPATLRWVSQPTGGPVEDHEARGVITVIFQLADSTADPARVYNTEILSLDLEPGNPLMLRESPTRASTGKTTYTDIGGGNYRIGSFFDIFVELSVDGGATWSPADVPLHIELAPAPVSVPSLAPVLPVQLSISPTSRGPAYPDASVAESFFDVFTEFVPMGSTLASVATGGNENWDFIGSGKLGVKFGSGLPTTGIGDVDLRVRVQHVRDEGDTREFETEMLSLNLSGGTLPAGTMLRESPTLKSTGKTTLRTLPDGTYRISSFFDVFPEISLDGGATWAPSDGPVRVNMTNPTGLIATGAGAGGQTRVKSFFEKGDKPTQDFFAYPGLGVGVNVAAGDVNGDGLADIVTGAGAGAGPHVKVFSGSDGALLQSFFAYSTAFTGGVNVAVGDVNGDGRADIITGAGPGGGPHVKVFDGRDGSEMRSFYAFAPGFTGGVRVAVGDVDGDGFGDVVAGAGAGGGGQVRVFSGQGGLLLESLLAFGSGFTDSVCVAVGDLNGDGLADLVVGTGSATTGGRVRTFDGGTLAQLVEVNPVFDPTFMGGVFFGSIGAGDLDGDGLAEIIAGAGVGGAPHVVVLNGRTGAQVTTFLAFDPAFTGGVSVAGESVVPGAAIYRDVLPPRLSLPGDLTVEATSPAGAVVAYSASATDLTSGVATSSFAPPSGSTFPIGTSVVNATATDNAGNAASGSFLVTVRDTTTPRVTVPANVVVATSAVGGVAVNYPAATATDAVGVAAITYSKASGSIFPYGETTVTVLARDAAGNVGAGSFTVTVKTTTVDTSAPVLAITSPSSTVTGNFNITGTVKDEVPIASFTVTVNGVPQALTVDPIAGFAPNVPVAFAVNNVVPEPGPNVIVVEVTSAAGLKSFKTVQTTANGVFTFPSAMVGTYAALLEPSEPGAIENSGLVSVTLAGTGSFSGFVQFADVKVPFAGVLTRDGKARFKPGLHNSFNMVDRTEFDSYLGTIEFSISETDGLSGTIMDSPASGDLIATFQGKVAPYSLANLVPASLLNLTTKGTYGIAFLSKEQDPPRDHASYPQGSGYATLALSSTGSINLSGVLADGSKYSAAGKLRSDGTIALFTPLYRKSGCFGGELAFDRMQADSDVTGQDFSWLRPVRSRARAFRDGWPGGITVDARGAIPVIPAGNISQGPPLATGNVRLTLSGPALGTPVTRVLNIDPLTGKVTFPAPVDPNLKFSVSATTGIVTGSLLIDGAPTTFRCIFLNKGSTQSGEGYGVIETKGITQDYVHCSCTHL